MKYVKPVLAITGLLLAAAILLILFQTVRTLLMDSARVLSALGDTPIVTVETPPPTQPPVYDPQEEMQEGGLDSDLLPRESYGNVVYDTEGLELFEVPVDGLAEDQPALTPEP